MVHKVITVGMKGGCKKACEKVGRIGVQSQSDSVLSHLNMMSRLVYAPAVRVLLSAGYLLIAAQDLSLG